MKHRLLHQFTRDEIKLAFDRADTQQSGHLRLEDLKTAIAHLNLHLPTRRIVESKSSSFNRDQRSFPGFPLHCSIQRLCEE